MLVLDWSLVRSEFDDSEIRSNVIISFFDNFVFVYIHHNNTIYYGIELVYI